MRLTRRGDILLAVLYGTLSGSMATVANTESFEAIEAAGSERATNPLDVQRVTPDPRQGDTRQAIEWVRTYGGAGDDQAYSMVKTTDGGYALAGDTSSFGSGGIDLWLVKTDALGNMEWSRTYGGPHMDTADCVIQTADGGYALAGSTFSDLNNRHYMVLVKTNASGEEEWNAAYGGPLADDYGYSVTQTADGGYAIVGTTYSYDVGGGDFWLVKTDSGGGIEWHQSYGGTDNEKPLSVVQTTDGGYAIAGYTTSFGGGWFDFWLVKTDASGNMQWNQAYGDDSDEIAVSLIQTVDGGYAVAGWSGMIPDPWRFMVVKTDSTGNPEWTEYYGGYGRESAWSILQTADKGFAVAGWTTSYGAGYKDCWLVKTDASGSMEWNVTYGTPDEEVATSLALTDDGGYAMAGWTNPYGAAPYDFLLVKIAPPVRDIAVTSIIPSKTVVCQGESLSVDVTVENQGDLTETFDLRLVVDGVHTFYDPFDELDLDTWTYYNPNAAEGYVSVSDGMLHVSGWYQPGYQDGGLTTIEESELPVTLETRLRPTSSTSCSPTLKFGVPGEPGFAHVYYDGTPGYSWHITYLDTSGMHSTSWGGSLSVGTWYKVKLIIAEDLLKVYFDDVLKVDTDWSPPEEFTKTVSLASSYGEYGSGDFDWVSIETDWAIDIVEAQTVTDLLPGEERTIVFTWDTIGIAPGGYTITAYAESVSGETETDDNSYVDGIVTILPPANPPEAETPSFDKNRYLSFVPDNPGWQTAIRVTFQDVPSPYDHWNGTILWVQEPQLYCENAGATQGDPCPSSVGGLSSTTFWGASLDCEPFYAVWTEYDVVHVWNEGIIAGGTYDLQAIGEACDTTFEGSYSSPLTLDNSIWGDLVKDCSTTPCGPPDGITGIVDVTAVLDKWKNLSGNVKKVRADIEGSPAGDHRLVDQAINITDVTYCLGAFLGETYPPPGFPAPSDPPVCP